MRYLSLFSGMEAASAAVERMQLGWQPIAFSEVEPAACAVLAHRWPHVPNLGDVTRVDWAPFRDQVDVLVGGPPCQDYSTAGLRAGLAGARGGLMMEYLDALAQIQPRWALCENVPGLLSSNGGRDFAAFLGGVGERGYCAGWRVLDALHYGVPQRRRRCWTVLHRGHWQRPAEILGFAESQGRDFLQGWTGWSTAARRASGGIGFSPDVVAVDFRNSGVDEFAGTLQCHPTSLNARPGLLHDGVLRRLTPTECLRLQGFDDDWLDGARLRGRPLSDSARYRMIGNSWAVPCAAWILERIAALDAAMRDTPDLVPLTPELEEAA